MGKRLYVWDKNKSQWVECIALGSGVGVCEEHRMAWDQATKSETFYVSYSDAYPAPLIPQGTEIRFIPRWRIKKFPAGSYHYEDVDTDDSVCGLLQTEGKCDDEEYDNPIEGFLEELWFLSIYKAETPKPADNIEEAVQYIAETDPMVRLMTSEEAAQAGPPKLNK